MVRLGNGICEENGVSKQIMYIQNEEIMYMQNEEIMYMQNEEFSIFLDHLAQKYHRNILEDIQTFHQMFKIIRMY